MTRPTFITLGPSGTCHENALQRYLDFQGLPDAEIVLVEDLLGAIEQVRSRPDTYLVQCSAHVQVHLVTERYHEEVFVVDTFLYPTKELALLVRTDVARPRSLGIVSATRGYTDLERWERIVDEPSKPVVARHLLAGRLRRRPHPPALRRRTSGDPAGTRVLRSGGHDLGGLRTPQALPRRRDREPHPVAVQGRTGTRPVAHATAAPPHPNRTALRAPRRAESELASGPGGLPAAVAQGTSTSLRCEPPARRSQASPACSSGSASTPTRSSPRAAASASSR